MEYFGEKNNPKVDPDLDRVDFNGVNLKNANLRRANFLYGLTQRC